jgi:autophagy-related protein 18
LLFDAVSLQAVNVVEAHQSPLSCIALNSDGTLLATASDKGTIIRVFSVPGAEKIYQFRRGTYPSRIFSMSFNLSSTFLCVSSATETVHIFRIGAPPPGTGRSGSPPTGPDKSLYADDALSGMDQSVLQESANRRSNGSLGSLFRRSSQTIGKTVAGAVGGYLPNAVTEMWEPTRDFAYLKVPKSGGAASDSVSPGGNNAGPVRSVVAMSSSSPQVMVVTSDGFFYEYNIDMEAGGEAVLAKQYS